MIAVVGLLVILVGGGSALGTMAFLANQDAVEPAAAQAAAAGVEPIVPAPSEVADAVKDEAVEDGAGGLALVEDEETSTGASPSAEVVVAAEPVADEGEASTDGGTTGGEAVPSEGHESGSTSADGEEEASATAASEKSNAEPSSPRAAGAATVTRKRPTPETAECMKVREGAAAAFKTTTWPKLIGLTNKTWCWSDAGELERKRWNVRALAEDDRYAQCVKVGRSSKDQEIRNIVAFCRKELGK